jgi:ribonuclease HI
MCLEVSYRNIRITERWKRNRSDVCAWKNHTEILELQRDGREIEVMYVLGSIIRAYNTSISLPSLCNSNISV